MKSEQSPLWFGAIKLSSALEILRTDTPTFQVLIEARRNRREEWFQLPAGRIEIGNVPVPVRSKRADPVRKP